MIPASQRSPQLPYLEIDNLETGNPFPQGATWDGKGVNFSIFAEAAEVVELCLFRGPRPLVERHRIRLTHHFQGIWHCYIPGLKPGQIYGYRIHGPYDPLTGYRFNPNKVVMDPYAKGIGRRLEWNDCLFGYSIGHPDEDLSYDERDNSAYAPLACVVDETFDWEGDEHLNRPWHDTVIYEAHVRGMTINHPQIPKAQRGTYAGLGSDVIIDHLLALGVTAIELMPIHHFIHDRHLIEKGLSNYWGYNTLGFFMPESSYSSERAPKAVLSEFKQMVKKFHEAGIEVILDVVYNHTAEGNQLGPTLSFRGIDNRAYYRLVGGNERYYMDYTGCGNTLNMMHPHSLRLLMDSLRYWVTEVHIDGFRFDLASALARELHEVNQLGAFLDTIYQDPVLATIKLIAEPWDLGEGGYQVGNFPVNWTEWNGIYRDVVRRFWKGEEALSSEAALRIVGSPDLYAGTRRRPSASINFITAHDGFTLKDLVSYNEKHNEANGDNNADGSNDNHSWNCGAEGKTHDPEVLALRARQRRNLFATLILSQGVPMISGGDELGRTQQGNNNVYCQDNDLAWHQWKLGEEDARFLKFAQRLVRLRRQHPTFRRRRYEDTESLEAAEQGSLEWIRMDGERMSETDWQHFWVKALALHLNGNCKEVQDDHGNRMPDDDFIILFNAHEEEVAFHFPVDLSGPWTQVIDTFSQELPAPLMEPVVKSPFLLQGHSLAVLRHAR
jgi:isoamylase